MLGVKAYEPDYVAACQRRLAAQLAALDHLVASAGSDVPDGAEAELLAALTIELDAFFAHRVRALESKDGNPLNEVRMLAHSLLHDEGVLAASTIIRYRPERAILGIPVGEPIRIDRSGFEKLATAYFDELRTRFT
jgi:hypothetical protein